LEKVRLQERVEGQLRVLRGGAAVPYVRLGAQISFLSLILAHWKEYPVARRGAAADDVLRALHQTLREAQMPSTTVGAIRALRAGAWEDSTERQMAAKAVENALKYFETAPS